MKKKVYEYIAQHPYSTANQCADALQIKGLDVLKIIHTLHKEGYLKTTALPLGNTYASENSNFYTVTRTYSE